MEHWIISNLPKNSLGIYTALECILLSLKGVNSDEFVASTLIGIIFFTIYISFILLLVNDKFERVITNIIVPEFIDKRPFREIGAGKKEARLQEILGNVNNKVQLEIGTNWSFSSTIDLVTKYRQCMNVFENKFNKVYRNLSIEDNVWDKIFSVTTDMNNGKNLNKYSWRQPVEIRGWDKLMLVARNIENEDVEYVMKQTISPELIQTYGTIIECQIDS